MDVAVEHFIREWGGVSNALKAAERNLEFWRSRGNRALTKRYEEVVGYLEEKVKPMQVKKDDESSVGVSRKRRVSKTKRKSGNQ